MITHEELNSRDILSAADVADILGVSRQTLAKWRYRLAHLPFQKIGGGYRYLRSDLEKYLAGSRCEVKA